MAARRAIASGGSYPVDTAIGRCTLRWSGDELTGVRLEPGAAHLATGDVPIWVRDLGSRLVRHFAGETQDFRSVPLATRALTDFERRVYRAASRVAAGATATYGDIAADVGSPGGARAVGGALGRNPFLVIVPCHRVVASGAKALGGFSAPGGLTTKRTMLALEGIAFDERGRPAPAPRNRPVPGAALPTDDGRFRAAIDALAAADTTLASWMAHVGACGLPVPGETSVFEALGESIVYQQLTGKAAATIVGRLKALFGGAFPTPSQVLSAGDVELRGVGLSGAKLAALRDLAAHVADGRLGDFAALSTMDDEALVEALSQVRGVGRWTAEMFLMFRLGRHDVLPVGDYGVRKGYGRLYQRGELPHARVLASHGERWKPYRSIASWYLWRAAEARDWPP